MERERGKKGSFVSLYFFKSKRERWKKIEKRGELR